MPEGLTRDYVLLYVNGREQRIYGDDVFQPASDYLRLGLMHCGTKVVCAEGDCGACSVLVGRPSADGGKLVYVPLNSCIQYLYQLDCTHVITVEGLGSATCLNPVQASMVDHHGAQCGYCTPGFVVAMTALAERVKSGQESLCEKTVKDSLTGNLCRCTGYESIIKAGLAVDVDELAHFSSLYPQEAMLAVFAEHGRAPLAVKTASHEVFNPTDLTSACRFLAQQAAEHQDKVVIVSGGTDVSVNINKKGLKPRVLMNTSALPGLGDITLADAGERQQILVGARVTLRELEYFVKNLLPEFYDILWVYGSPQIRHAGTLAGNIGNGSPIADSLPFFMVMGGSVEVTGTGGTRTIAAADLYCGYKQLTLQKDELITRIILPLPKARETLKLYKISKRQHLDISAFTASFLLDIEADTIVSARIFYGGVGPLVLPMKDLEAAIIGRPFVLSTFESASKLVAGLIKPIDDVRGSRGYRLTLAENILLRFYHDVQAERQKKGEVSCR